MTLIQILAIVIFALMFILIIMEKWHRYIPALGGAVLMLIFVFRNPSGMLWAMNFKEIFASSFWITRGVKEELSHGINWQTIIFIGGMMIMIEGLARVGFFRWLCLLVAHTVRFQVIPIFVSFMLLSGFLSMFIDSITVMLFLASVTIEIARLLKFDPIPMIIAEIFAANTGGSATMCGDPPNIIIGTAFGFSFFDFLKNTGLVAGIGMAVSIIYFYLIFKKQLASGATTTDHHPEPAAAITDRPLFYIYSFVFLIVITLLITHNSTHISVAFIGCIAAFLITIFGYQHIKEIIKAFDWRTVLFFVGLFVCVAGLEHTGVLKIFAGLIGKVSRGNVFMLASVILWFSAFASAIVDNIPFAATMVPVVFGLHKSGMPLTTLSWSLALGTDIGGNGTPIGASANVVGIATAEKHGYRVGWSRYCRHAMPGMILVILICNILIFLLYF